MYLIIRNTSASDAEGAVRIFSQSDFAPEPVQRLLHVRVAVIHAEKPEVDVIKMTLR
jgi:hypothetical protein